MMTELLMSGLSLVALEHTMSLPPRAFPRGAKRVQHIACLVTASGSCPMLEAGRRTTFIYFLLCTKYDDVHFQQKDSDRGF